MPSFFYHLGDVVYNFGEAAYYYDQFYEPYRNYPAPILGIPGNHDGVPIRRKLFPRWMHISAISAPRPRCIRMKQAGCHVQR